MFTYARVHFYAFLSMLEIMSNAMHQPYDMTTKEEIFFLFKKKKSLKLIAMVVSCRFVSYRLKVSLWVSGWRALVQQMCIQCKSFGSDVFIYRKRIERERVIYASV